MQIHVRDNLAKFFYDSGKVSFAVLVIGGATRKPLIVNELVWGISFTLILVLFAVILGFIPAEGK